MPGVFKEWISSGVTEREHANATISSIGALSQCERPVGSFLVDLRGETRFAGVAGAAGSGGGGVTLTAGTGMPGAGLHWAVEGGSATLAAGIGLRAAGNADAAEGAGGTLVATITGLPAPGPPGAAEHGTGGIVTAGTTKLPAARSPGAVEGGSAILAARTFGLRATRPPRALEGAGVTVAVATTGLSGAGPPGGVAGGGGGIIPAGNIGLAGAGGGGGINAVASTAGSSGAAASAGGIDSAGPFRRRAGISEGFSTGGATLTSASGFELGAVFLRRRFGREPAARRAFAFPGLVFFLCASSMGDAFPRRSTPGGSCQIHFTAPLPPSVRMKCFFSRRRISSITQRFEEPVKLASSAISIWRPPRLGVRATLFAHKSVVPLRRARM